MHTYYVSEFSELKMYLWKGHLQIATSSSNVTLLCVLSFTVNWNNISISSYNKKHSMVNTTWKLMKNENGTHNNLIFDVMIRAVLEQMKWDRNLKQAIIKFIAVVKSIHLNSKEFSSQYNILNY